MSLRTARCRPALPERGFRGETLGHISRVTFEETDEMLYRSGNIVMCLFSEGTGKGGAKVFIGEVSSHECRLVPKMLKLGMLDN